jgi:putative colanic acid biosynthesis glycosyltransferase
LKLSVITITFNDLDGLKRTCNTIQSQTFTDFEHIIIDGASNDGTCDFLAEWQKQNGKNKFISEPDTGIYNAMNKGIKLSTGEWMIFINAGDEFAFNDTLQLALSNKEFTNPEYKVIYGHKFNKERELERSKNSPTILNTGELFSCHQSMFFSDKSLYDESYKIFGDYELLARLYKRFGKKAFKQIDLPIAVFEGGGISSKISSTKRKEKFRAISLHFGLKGLLTNYFLNPIVWKKLLHVKV